MGLVGGGRVGTLLGPEASGPSYRSHRMLCGVSRVVWVMDGCLDCVSGCSPLSRVPGWVCGGLVGLLFEICIVDASIN